MFDSFDPHYIAVGMEGDICTATFIVPQLTDDENVEQIGRELFALVDQYGCRKILLDLERVRFITSSVLGKIISLHRRMHRGDGRLILCRPEGEVSNVLNTSKLNQYFHIVTTLEEAKTAFSD